MDADYLAERIIKDLDGIFAKDPNIADFEILPVSECVKNKCPVIHVAHQVGLESWCIKHVFHYAYRNVLDWRSNRQPSKYNGLLGWTRAVLLINPDIQVAWNIRKELVECEKQDLESEFKFSAIALSRKPKSAEVFIHRRWLLSAFMKTNSFSKLTTGQAETEFQLCFKAAEKYSQNYYAWSHRIWVVQRIDTNPIEAVQLELQSTEGFIQKHISDHSGFQYRQFLFSWLIQNANSNKEVTSCQSKDFQTTDCQSCSRASEGIELAIPLLFLELEANSDFINFYEGHESLWYHRRFILHTLKSIVPTPKETKRDPHQLLHRQTAKRSKLEVFMECSNLEGEESFLEKIRINNKGQVGNAQNLFLEKHVQWLRRVLNISSLTGETPKLRD